MCLYKGNHETGLFGSYFNKVNLDQIFQIESNNNNSKLNIYILYLMFWLYSTEFDSLDLLDNEYDWTQDL